MQNPKDVTLKDLSPKMRYVVAEWIGILNAPTVQLGGGIPLAPQIPHRATESAEQQNNLAAEEAQKVSSAIGNWRELSDYIATCKVCEFRNEAIAERETLQAAAYEEHKYNLTRGSIRDLKEYVASCKVCAFAKEAVQQIKAAQLKYEKSFVEITICNRDSVPVFIAITGKQDPVSEMWTSIGWSSVGSGECQVVARRVKPLFYYYAYSERHTWSGNVPAGTSPGGDFTILWTKEGECLDDQVAKNFAEVWVVGDSNTYKLTFGGKP